MSEPGDGPAPSAGAGDEHGGAVAPRGGAVAQAGAAPDPFVVERIATRARAVARRRLRQALQAQTTADGERWASALDDQQLDRLADEEADRADGPLLRVSVAEAAAEELALAHELLREGSPRSTADAEVQARAFAPPALLVQAVHVFGIEAVAPGDTDIELRLADTGIDVRRPSTSKTIGRLQWEEVQTVVVQRPQRGPDELQRPARLLAGTDRGEVTFELIGLSDEEITKHLEPLIARNCDGFEGAVAS
jgi:hypothetical protein